MFCKQKYYIDESFSECLHSAVGLDYGQFFKCKRGRLIASEPGQTIQFFELPYDQRPTGFYLKQNFIRPKSIKRLLLKGTITPLFTTQEAKMTKILAQHNLPVATIAAWGENLLFGKIPIGGFMLSREIKGNEAVELFEKNDIELRCRILYAVGTIMAKLAEIGSYYSPRMRDFICINDDGNKVELTIIDREVKVPELEAFSEQTTYEFISRSYWKMIKNGHPVQVNEFNAFINGFLHGLSLNWKPTKPEVIVGCLKANYRLYKKIKQIAKLIDQSDFDKIMHKRYSRGKSVEDVFCPMINTEQ